MRLAFSHLNLRVNPFGEPSPADRARLALVDGAELAGGEILQFLGDSGRGTYAVRKSLAPSERDASQ